MNKTIINSFDGTEIINGFIERPEKYSHLYNIANSTQGIIARGSGLSYCAAASGNDITSIDMKRFNRILSFDEANGIIKVECGLTIGNFISFIVKRGWYFNVIPGYPSITIGGCIAFNVHGKSQFNIGTFGNHVKELTLYHPAYGEIVCNRSQNKDIFNLTIGGFGLTGVILDVTLVLSPLQGNSITRDTIKCKNLSDSVEKMHAFKNDSENVYSWNNLNLSDSNFGKGIIYREKFYQGKAFQSKDYNYTLLKPNTWKKFGVNFINNFTQQFISFVYYQKENIAPSSSILSIAESTFPIYGKEIYYYLFGKQGFREYQLIVPLDKADNLFFGLHGLIKKYNMPVSLGSLKLFKGENKYLNFCTDGICLAIDIPATAKSINFFSEIDSLVIKSNGIANLSKDSRLQANTLAKMFKEYSYFKSELFRYDPRKCFTSSLRQRIEV